MDGRDLSHMVLSIRYSIILLLNIVFDRFFADRPVNFSSELNAVAETSVSSPEDVCNRMKKNLTSFEKEHFSPKNVMPERLCSAYFRTTEDLKFQDVLSAITNSGVPAEEVRCIQYKKVSQFAKEVHVTFSSPTFCSRFVNSTSLAVNEKSYFILSAHRPVTFVDVFDAPFELADEAIIKRLEDFYGCQVVNTYRNCHQGTKIPNGGRTFSVILNGHLPATLQFGRFQVRLFHRDQEQMCHKCNRYGHFARECPNVVCFNCDNLGHISKECPDSPRCCICKSLNHLAINCEYSWGSSVINSAGASSFHHSSITDTKSNATATQMDVEDSSNVSAPAASEGVVLVHVPDPVKPQQSQPLLSSQPATLPSSSAPLSSGVASSTYSHVLQSSLPFSTESPTPLSSSSSSAPSTRINRARSDSLVDPLRRVANVPVLLRPSKALSPRRTSPVDGSPTVSKRSKPSKTYSSRSR